MIFFHWICWALLRLILGARYRLHVRGLEQVKTMKGPGEPLGVEPLGVRSGSSRSGSDPTHQIIDLLGASLKAGDASES